MMPVHARAVARRDGRAIVAHYRTEADSKAAQSFVGALNDALQGLAEHPLAGSSRLGVLAGRPDVRAWPIKNFPHLIIYRALPLRVDILRILHSARDIPASLRE